VIVVVIVPIAIRAPALGVRIPPAVRMIPAILPCLRELLPPLRCLGTIPSVMFRRFVQLVIGFVYAVATAIVIIACSHRGRRGEQQETA